MSGAPERRVVGRTADDLWGKGQLARIAMENGELRYQQVLTNMPILAGSKVYEGEVTEAVLEQGLVTRQGAPGAI